MHTAEYNLAKKALRVYGGITDPIASRMIIPLAKAVIDLKDRLETEQRRNKATKERRRKAVKVTDSDYMDVPIVDAVEGDF